MLIDFPYHPLRVLHVRPRLGIGGATEYLIRLAESQAEAGYHVVVASGGGEWLRRITGFTRSYDRLPLTPILAPANERRIFRDYWRLVSDWRALFAPSRSI